MLTLIHTIPTLISDFDTLCGEILPGVPIKHILDEPLLEGVRRRGRLDPADAACLLGHVQAAAAAGAQAVLVTCSTISPLVDEIQSMASIPIFKIDQAMIAAAVQAGDHLGVVATNRTTLEPTRLLLDQEAWRTGRTIKVEQVFVEGALPALLAGDGTAHDRLVCQAVVGLAPRVQAVVLAQASMARVMEALPELPCPVYSSPRLALRQINQEVNFDSRS